MTRRCILILVAIFVSLFTAHAIPISAQENCQTDGNGLCVVIPLTGDDALFHVQVVASPAQAAEPRAIYRVSDSVYYVPVSGGMWAIFDFHPDGMVIEDYVSGPPPTNGIALDATGAPMRAFSCEEIPTPCEMP